MPQKANLPGKKENKKFGNLKPNVSTSSMQNRARNDTLAELSFTTESLKQGLLNLCKQSQLPLKPHHLIFTKRKQSDQLVAWSSQ